MQETPMKRSILTLAAAGLLCGCATQSSPPSGTFSASPQQISGVLARNLSPRDELQRVAYLQNHFVAIGGKGVLISPDAQHWSGFSAVQAGLLRGGDSGNGVTVLVGDQSLARSSDLRSWELRPAPSAFSDVAFGQGAFVAVGDAGAVFRSSDGLDWVPQNSGTSVHLSDILYRAGLFVAVGDGGTILTSPDGTSWTAQTTPSGDNLLAISQAGTDLLAVGTSGTLWSSGDARVWTPRNSGTGDGLHGACSGAALQLVAGGESHGLILTSTDGIRWSGQPFRPLGLNSAAFGGDTFVAVGQAGHILRSSDGRNWTDCAPGTTPFQSLSDVCLAPGETAVAVGQAGTILLSRDGIGWARQSSPTRQDLSDVDSSAELTVAVGSAGTIVSASASGPWRSAPSPVETDLLEVHHAEGLWLAAGEQGTLITSPDGLRWTPQAVGTSKYLCAIASAGPIVVIGGQEGALLLSRDSGKSWTAVNSGSDATLIDMVYADGQFVAVGLEGVILVSSDGLHWSRRNSGSDGTLFDVAYSQGLWLAVGQSGLAVSSADGGTSWREVAPVCDNGLSGVVAHQGSFLAVGLHGQVVEFTPTSSGP